MKEPVRIILIISLVLLAGLVTAGCTESSSTDVSQSAGTPAAVSGSDASPSSGNPVPDAGSNAAAVTGSTGNDQPDTGQAGTGQSPGYGHAGRGQGQGFMNESRINAAAGKLGVSGDALKNALNGTSNSTSGRPDFAAAAQQLGITQQQLTDAFGFPAGGFGNGTHSRGNWSGTPGQGPDGQIPGQGPGQ